MSERITLVIAIVMMAVMIGLLFLAILDMLQGIRDGVASGEEA